MKTFQRLNAIIFILIFMGCQKEGSNSFGALIKDSPSIPGKPEYLNSPYVTAGNRVYMVGHQDGSFPDIGWHIKGEMGGIWNHPIKLMDGFDASLKVEDETIVLDAANSFVNFPMANMHNYNYEESKLKVERWQFVPDDYEGIIIQYNLKNLNNESKEIELTITGHSDLRPTWLGERTDMSDSQDLLTYDESISAFIAKDSLNPWFSIYGSNLDLTARKEVEYSQQGLGTSGALSYLIKLEGNEERSINFVIAGSYKSLEQARKTYSELHENADVLLTRKSKRYESLANRAKLNIPDKNLEQTFEWLKYNCDWLIREVPEIGRGIGAGIPDYPWWFGVDSEYALKGYMAIGQDQIVYDTIELLDSVSNAVNGNGRIIHEMSTNGAVFNRGNINETPQFASLIWEIYKWNGDTKFLAQYFPTIRSGLNWLMDANDENKNLFPDGFGMMEIHGLDSEMIDVAAYTQRAFADAAKIAAELNEKQLSRDYLIMADSLKEKINSEFWSEEFNSYADFIGTDEQALHLIEDAIIRADTLNKPWAIEELKQTREAILANPSSKPRPFVLHHNWVVNTPMEMEIADPEKAIKALDTGKRFVNPFGVFVTGIDRDESAGSDDGSFKGSKIFSYTGAVMTLPTGVQAVAENNYNRPDQALNYLQRMARTFSYALPGSIYEVSPDYGMMTQAWNIYSFAIPVVQQFFGIDPLASKKQISINPKMPGSWNEASLENIEIGDNSISVFYKRQNGKQNLLVEQKDSSWELQIILEGTNYEILEGEGTIKSVDGQSLISVSGKRINIKEN